MTGQGGGAFLPSSPSQGEVFDKKGSQNKIGFLTLTNLDGQKKHCQNLIILLTMTNLNGLLGV